MINPKCSPEAVARNLLKLRDEALMGTVNAYAGYQHDPQNLAKQGAYNKAMVQWQRACQDVRDFRQLHPSAFSFEEVTEEA